MTVGFADGTRAAEVQRAEDAEAGADWSWKWGTEGKQVLEMRAGRASTNSPEEHLIHFPGVRHYIILGDLPNSTSFCSGNPSGTAEEGMGHPASGFASSGASSISSPEGLSQGVHPERQMPSGGKIVLIPSHQGSGSEILPS